MRNRYWASRDKRGMFKDFVYLWDDCPSLLEGRVFCGGVRCSRIVQRIPDFIEHDLKPGECVEIEPIRLVRKKIDVPKSTFKFSDSDSKFVGNPVKGQAKKRSVKRGKA